jgi:hypothetical protein
MKDVELVALATFVESESRRMRIADEERFRNGNAPAYGDCRADGEEELVKELKARGILK